MIDEKKLIAKIRNAINNDDRYNGYTPAAVLFEVYDMITEIPKIDSWIPCNEKRPEDRKDCIVTVLSQNPHTRIPCYMTFYNKVYFDGEYWRMPDGRILNREVVAWQPLPEPWEGER